MKEIDDILNVVLGFMLASLIGLFMWVSTKNYPSAITVPAAFEIESRDYCEGFWITVLVHKKTGKKFVSVYDSGVAALE